MSEPVNLDLWQSAAEQGPVNLDLGASPDVANIYAATINAINKLTSADINAATAFDANINAGTAATSASVSGTVIYSGVISAVSQLTVADIDPAIIFVCNIDALNKPLTCRLPADYLLTGTMASASAALQLSGSGTYDINVYRDPAGYGGNVWAKQGSPAHHEPGVIDWQVGNRLPADKPVAWQEAGQVDTNAGYPFGLIPHSQQTKAEKWAEAISAGIIPGWLYRDIPKAHISKTASHSEALSAGHSAVAPFWLLLPRIHLGHDNSWQIPDDLGISLQRQLISKGRWLGKQSNSLYEEAIWPLPGVSDHTLPPIIPPINIGDVNLNFYRERQFNTDLEFWVDIGAATVIPIRRVYLVSNSASVIRLRDGMDIPTTSVSIDYDDDSWAWQCSVTVPQIAAAEALEGEEMLISINGYEWIMSVDGWSDNKAWNSQSATITGRSRTKELSSSIILPSSYTEAQSRTIIQLAEQELITGWTMNWTAADWLVPGGIYSYSNKAPIDVIAELAEAAGAFIMPHQSNRQISVLPKYKAKPWELSSQLADIQIPASIMINRGRKREHGTNANGAWITGGNAGITALVKRTGTAADKLLADTTNALITDVTGATALGIKLLAESMDRCTDTIELPISADTGLILPGNVLSVPDGKAYARSFKATAQMSNSKLVVRQSIEIERPLLV